MIFVYLGLLLWIAIIRGPRLFGHHLECVHGHKGWLRKDLYLYLTSSYRIRELYAVHIGMESQQTLLPFVVRKERFYHRYFKSIGLAHEIHIPDHDFDQKYYITTDVPHHLEDLMNSGKLLGDLKTLMAKNVSAIHVFGHRVWCVLADADHKKTHTELSEYYQLLKNISKAAKAPKFSQKRFLRPFIASCFLVAHLTFFMWGFVSVIPELDTPDTIESLQMAGFGLLAGCFAIFLWNALIVALFRKSSWLGWVMADFWVFGVIGMLVGGMTLTHHFNQNLSPSTSALHIERVNRRECTLVCFAERKFSRHSKVTRFKYAGDIACEGEHRKAVFDYQTQTNPSCKENARFEYEILMTSWRKGEDSTMVYRTEVLPEVFDALREGGNVIVHVNSGALGFEWVDYKKIIPFE